MWTDPLAHCPAALLLIPCLMMHPPVARSALRAFPLGALLLTASAPAPTAIEGRWDLVVQTPEGPQPSWLEVRHSGTAALVGQFVWTGGSARPISRVTFESGTFRFVIPPQWERDGSDLTVEGHMDGDGIAGTLTRPDGVRLTWTGKRAPTLRRATPPVWAAPVKLFSGHDLSGWHVFGGEGQWKASAGVLQNTKAGGNLATDRTFTDFKLHVEFRYPKGGNSGVYLRGRYEVQVEDSPGPEPVIDGLGAIYGFLTPNQYVALGAGVWHTYDITLAGRTVTVVVNGKTVISLQEIPGITGGALSSDEGAPGPIYLQGDHGPVEYRNIIITPARDR